MKKLHIFTLLIAILAIVGCTEEKTFSFEAEGSKGVDFSVINLTVGVPDTARSIMYVRYYYYSPYESREFNIDYYYPNEDYVSTRHIYLSHSNELWAGGNNELQFTFHPSCPEEKSAKFTMPDGKVFETTSDSPSFVWTVTSEALKNVNDLYNADFSAIAESEYQIGNSHYKNKSYVEIDLDTYLIYTPTGKWYEHNWTSGNPVTLKGNVNFSAKNLTVNETDSAVSVKYDGYYYTQGSDSRICRLNLYTMSKDSVPEIYNKNWSNTIYYKNELWAGGNNEIEITYNPQQEDGNEVKMVFPDGQTAILTAEKPTTKWTLNKDSFNNLQNSYSSYYIIEAYSSNTEDVICYDNHGYILLSINTKVWYNPDYSLWFYGNWTK